MTGCFGTKVLAGDHVREKNISRMMTVTWRIVRREFASECASESSVGDAQSTEELYDKGAGVTEVITVVADLKAKPGKEEELRKAALALIEPTRKEQGCIQYDLHVHLTDAGRVVFYENWATVKDLDRHGQSPHLKAFGAMAPDLVESRNVERFRRIA